MKDGGKCWMPKIEYIELLDNLKLLEINNVILTCCNPSATSFSVLRAQIKGDVYYSSEYVRLYDPKHNEKCQMLLETAKSNYIDLVIFPEYCISYELLDKIVNNKELWPDMMKLWCLPCQGIATKDFEDFLEGLKSKENIILIDALWNHSVNKKKFVNACFYCFLVIDKDEKECLCLAPQFKTHNMSDPTCECEMAGLTTGIKLFTINHRLITLLCADALNNDIYWQDLQSENLTNGLLLLHPQLNKKPKHSQFCRIRQDMQSHNHPGICITCNWAENTRIIRAEDKNVHDEITLAWSCIYHKRQDVSFEDWKKKDMLRKRNSAHGLFGAFMTKQRMEVWFSPSSEQAIVASIPIIASNQYAVSQIGGITADKQFLWSNDTACWQAQEFRYTLKERMEEPEVSKGLGQISGICNILSEGYRYPFKQQDKYLVDQFFALTLPTVEDSLMTIDERENLSDWSLLLDASEYDDAIDSLRQFGLLTQTLQKGSVIPARLRALKEHHCFCYELPVSDYHRSNINASDQRLLIVFSKNDVDAHKIVKRLITEEFNNNIDLAEQFLGVIYIDIYSNEPHFLPEYSSEIDLGDNIITEGDITNGRN